MLQMEEYLKAVTEPKGQSSETYPDGTPKTNMEAYLDKYDEERARSKDWHYSQVSAVSIMVEEV